MGPVDELRGEGFHQHHCIGSPRYVYGILKGRWYAYRILVPERATCLLKRQGNSWILEDARGAYNELVQNRTIQTIEQWLRQESKE